MAIAWMVQQRAGKSGWVDTVWTTNYARLFQG
jgi:steroid 5-alpha reductase family enzyme